MPELPEVETLRRALIPLIDGKTFDSVCFTRPDLRFPIPTKILEQQLPGKKLSGITRKGKYLLLEVDSGSMLCHLGMSGRVTQRNTPDPQEKHTHAVFGFRHGLFLHFVDPRRFGAILWVPKGEGHPLLDTLGPDPLAATTTGRALYEQARHCRGPVKNFLMNAKRIAGVGNIYACETLFEARISPRRGAHRISLKTWDHLLACLRKTLEKSIAAGGTTLKDFFSTDGTPGYFAIDLAVYGRENAPCPVCQTPIVRIVQSGRSTFFCRSCQKK